MTIATLAPQFCRVGGQYAVYACYSSAGIASRWPSSSGTVGGALARTPSSAWNAIAEESVVSRGAISSRSSGDRLVRVRSNHVQPTS